MAKNELQIELLQKKSYADKINKLNDFNVKKRRKFGKKRKTKKNKEKFFFGTGC